MNATIDAKHRAQIKHFAVGDLVRIEPQSEDVVVLRRLKPAPDKCYKPRIVRRKNGELVSVGGKPVTSEEVKRILEDEL